MTAIEVEVRTRGLVERSLRDQRDQVRDSGPTGEAPDHAGEQQSVHSGKALVQDRPASATGRVHGMTVLSLIAVTQLAWLSMLGYALFRLLA